MKSWIFFAGSSILFVKIKKKISEKKYKSDMILLDLREIHGLSYIGGRRGKSFKEKIARGGGKKKSIQSRIYVQVLIISNK